MAAVEMPGVMPQIMVKDRARGTITVVTVHKHWTVDKLKGEIEARLDEYLPRDRFVLVSQGRILHQRETLEDDLENSVQGALWVLLLLPAT